MSTDKMKDDESFFTAYWLYLLAGVLLLSSLTWMYYHQKDDPWHGVAEALCIACVLAILVDPFVKQRLAHEVNKSIFYRVIGFDLPPKIQDRLSDYLRGLKYYRESLSITAKVVSIGEDHVIMEIIIDGPIIALTRCEYVPSLEFEDAEHGKVEELWAKRPGKLEKPLKWSATDPSATTHLDPMTTKYSAPVAKLKAGDTLECFYRFTLRLKKQDYWVQTFGMTTLKAAVTLKPQDKVKMYASNKTPTADNCYEYDRVFIKGETICIRWQVEDAAGNG